MSQELDVNAVAQFLANAYEQGEEALKLAMQLTGTEPCPKCQFVKYGCKCPPNSSEQFPT